MSPKRAHIVPKGKNVKVTPKYSTPHDKIAGNFIRTTLSHALSHAVRGQRDVRVPDLNTASLMHMPHWQDYCWMAPCQWYRDDFSLNAIARQARVEVSPDSVTFTIT